MEDGRLSDRLASLKEHLQLENPLLVEAVGSFGKLDKVCRGIGLLGNDQSTISQIAWWPLISVLGPFSAGKSTFINYYLGTPVQQTGSHAVDDKFTVICYNAAGESRVLPGTALNADLRFPFYKMSEELEKVEPGEGGRIDSYIRLKTSPSDKLRGLILIDSPGFDADAQRTSTLRITNYIMDLSDLVLVLFDARRPEPGAMRDTLTHLVAATINRRDSNKFIYILNQMDIAAREDNPEEVVGAWQRALAQQGLTAGKFYRIYAPTAAVPIPDEALRQRFEAKRDADMAAIHNRMNQVRVERAYRIVGELEKLAREVEDVRVPEVRGMLIRWRKGVVRRDMALFGALAFILAAAYVLTGHPFTYGFAPVWMEWVFAESWRAIPFLLLCLGGGFWLHSLARKWSAASVARMVEKAYSHGPVREGLLRALAKNTAPWRSIFCSEPAGWGQKYRRILSSVIADSEKFIQSLNDRYAHPSGVWQQQPEPKPQAQPGAAGE
ncbi:dynamin family protein [Solidesulfovibrio alcoholivorans]|uniref:dynamin family protein n=1 Tax=Solidesulfovibrio alcoholivorans TaxID=81406 RepID=UPI000693E44D|nr:dynamin family protein [Solidesulfovibrio alcoholivorans]